MKTPIFIIFALAILLAPVASNGQETQRVYTSDILPTFSIISPRVKNSLTLFISPSCTFCAETFLGVVNAINSQNPVLANSDITFVLIPRRAGDAEKIIGFLCVPSRQRLKALHDFYVRFSKSNGNSDAQLYRQTLAKYGVSGSKLQRCLQDKTKNQAVAATLEIANSKRKLRTVPALVYNNRWFGASSSASVLALAKRKRR